MASLFKPKHPKLRTVKRPDGKPVTEERIAKRGANAGKTIRAVKREPVLGRDGKAVYVQSKRWYIRYRDADEISRDVPGFTDRAATLELAAQLERDAERRRVGMVERRYEVPDQRQYARIEEHVEDWGRMIRDKDVPKGGVIDHGSGNGNHCSAIDVFYVVQLIPDALPQRMKLGFSSVVVDRLAGYRTAAPTARLYATWPCPREYEHEAMGAISKHLVHVGREVFDCWNLDLLKAEADEFFASLRYRLRREAG